MQGQKRSHKLGALKMMILLYNLVNKMAKAQALPLLLWFSCLFAEAKPLTHKLSPEVQNIRIEAHQAHIRLRKATGKTKQLKIQYKKPLKITQDHFTLRAFEEGFPKKETAWRALKKNPVMTIWAPKLPIKIAVFGGKVEVSKFWNTDISISMPGKGAISIQGQQGGNTHISQGAGTINITAHQGNLNIQSEDSAIYLQSCAGHITVNSFKGRLTVNKSRGDLFVRSFIAPLVLNHFTGRLNFRQEKGGVYLKPVIGSITGYSNAGEVRGAVSADKVNIETKTGKIHLDLPHSKAWVNAQTWEGRIATPVYFSRIKTGGMDRSKGQLKGKKKGNVFLKSQSGSIRVYQSAH